MKGSNKKFQRGASSTRNRLTLACLAGLLSAASHAQLINSFETPADLGPSSMVFTGLTWKTTTNVVTNGLQALQLNFPATGKNTYPGIIMNTMGNANFVASGGYAFDLTNPGSQPVTFSVSIMDSAGKTLSQNVTIEPQASTTYRVGNEQSVDTVAVYGMSALPTPYRNMRSIRTWVTNGFGGSNVVKIYIFQREPTVASTLIVDNVRMLAAFDQQAYLNGMLDQFGQYSRENWPGKVSTIADLQSEISKEFPLVKGGSMLGTPESLGKKAMNAMVATAYDKYGGVVINPPMTATGFFRTEKYKNKWWIVDPLGNPFFSMGVDGVRSDCWTMVTGREGLYSSLPPNTGDTAQHYLYANSVFEGPVAQGWTFNPYTYNLARKFGVDWKNQFTNYAVKRLKAWGFNTIGAYSTNMYLNGQMPYTAFSATYMGTHKTVSTGVDYWGPLPDPYDPQFKTDFLALNTFNANRIKNDPLCTGWMIDNELSWQGPTGQERIGIGMGTLKADAASSPAKQAFIAALQAQYGAIDNLNSAWGTNFASWAAMSPSYAIPSVPNAAMTADLRGWALTFARKYFSTLRSTLKQIDPNHMYMGPKFGFGAWTPEVLQAAAENTDCLSVNWAPATVTAGDVSTFVALDRPVIISEFQFGATDRGMLAAGFGPCKDQNDRGQKFTAFANSTLNNPVIVGFYYYQFLDLPTTGSSFNGESFNLGMVSVNDTPYPEITSAAKKINTMLPGLRINTP